MTSRSFAELIKARQQQNQQPQFTPTPYMPIRPSEPTYFGPDGGYATMIQLTPIARMNPMFGTIWQPRQESNMMMNQPFGGGGLGFQQMQQNPQAMNMIRQMLMARAMQQNPQMGQQQQMQRQMQAPQVRPQAPQGGYSPTNAAAGNPQQNQMMNQNRFMQMLQQRLGGRY